MEIIATPRATSAALAPTRLDLIARGGVASPAYLDVERTFARAREMLSLAMRPAPIAAYRALATRCMAHAEHLFRNHVREVETRLPAGITIRLPARDSDIARRSYRQMLEYGQQAEQRIASLRAVRASACAR